MKKFIARFFILSVMIVFFPFVFVLFFLVISLFPIFLVLDVFCYLFTGSYCLVDYYIDNYDLFIYGWYIYLEDYLSKLILK